MHSELMATQYTSCTLPKPTEYVVTLPHAMFPLTLNTLHFPCLFYGVPFVFFFFFYLCFFNDSFMYRFNQLIAVLATLFGAYLKLVKHNCAPMISNWNLFL